MYIKSNSHFGFNFLSSVYFLSASSNISEIRLISKKINRNHLDVYFESHQFFFLKTCFCIFKFKKLLNLLKKMFDKIISNYESKKKIIEKNNGI